MRTLLRSCWPPLMAAGILVFALSDPFWAQDKKGTGKTAQALDKAVDKALHDVINYGADLFNINGDYAGCYRAYEAGLIAVKPFLAHRPDLQKSIDAGLAEAAQRNRVVERAFALRKVLAQVRVAVGGSDLTAGKDKKTTDKKDTDKKVTTKSLWDRLGGAAKVKKVVKDFVKLSADNPKVDVTRGGKYKLDDKTIKLLEKHLVEFVSSATGGPLKYKGPNMKEVHKGMDITNAEFNAAKSDLKKALEKNGAGAVEIKELLQIVEGTRKDIVEKTKKPADKDKKDTDKKKDTGKVGTVSGVVMLKGQPAGGAGYLTLVSGSDKRSFSTFIHPDGTYFFRSPIPAGEYVILIEKGPKEAGQEPPPIPERYRSPATSGLRHLVFEGNQRLDLDLAK